MPEKDSKKPNVLFVICDDLNSAINGMGRTPFARTPNIDRLRHGGVSFNNAHANCPLCLPSRNSLFSGLYPHTTGHYTLWDDWPTTTHISTTRLSSSRRWSVPLLGQAVMLPQHFKNNGYNTFGAGKVFHQGKLERSWWSDFAYGPDYGPLCGNSLEKIRLRPDRQWLLEDEPLKSYVNRYEGLDNFFLQGKEFRVSFDLMCGPLVEAFNHGKEAIWYGDGKPYHYTNDNDRDPLPDEKTTAWGIDILRQTHDKPFFLALGFMKPHTPLNVPQKYFDMYPPQSLAQLAQDFT